LDLANICAKAESKRGFLLALMLNSGSIPASLKEPILLTDVRCSAYVRVAAQIT
jgi:hypothetical protein